jgi:uncharacterized protein
MKPADHPDFFRLAAPDGRSRESSIVLDQAGRFWHDGTEVQRKDMQNAFARWLKRHPDNGRFILENGYDWTYVTVLDVPYFVRGVRPASGGPELLLTDGSVERLGAESLSVDAQGVLYAYVKKGSEKARFTPSAQRELEPFLVERDGALFLLGPDGPKALQFAPLPGQSDQ